MPLIDWRRYLEVKSELEDLQDKYDRLVAELKKLHLADNPRLMKIIEEVENGNM